MNAFATFGVARLYNTGLNEQLVRRSFKLRQVEFRVAFRANQISVLDEFFVTKFTG